ncbi:MAG: hypothetical protein ACI93T_002091, partial [Porticoccaceae bacterium]
GLLKPDQCPLIPTPFQICRRNGGYALPTKLPPKGQVTIIVGHRDAHTFLILLDSAGNMTFFRGGPTDEFFPSLKVEIGKYGKGAEPYMPKITTYNSLGNTKEKAANSKLKKLMDRLNKAGHSYGTGTDNCNSTSCLGIEALGKNVPSKPVPSLKRSTPGWGASN